LSENTFSLVLIIKAVILEQRITAAPENITPNFSYRELLKQMDAESIYLFMHKHKQVWKISWHLFIFLKFKEI